MDQPTAEEALKQLEPLVGEWTFEAKPPDGPPWPGEARATIEWHDSGAHLVARSTVEMPEAPDSRNQGPLRSLYQGCVKASQDPKDLHLTYTTRLLFQPLRPGELGVEDQAGYHQVPSLRN